MAASVDVTMARVALSAIALGALAAMQPAAVADEPGRYRVHARLRAIDSAAPHARYAIDARMTPTAPAKTGLWVVPKLAAGACTAPGDALFANGFE